MGLDLKEKGNFQKQINDLKKVVNALQAENTDLKQRVEVLEGKVTELETA